MTRASCYLLLLAIFLLSNAPNGMAKTISRLTPVEFNKIIMSWETDFTAMLSKAMRDHTLVPPFPEEDDSGVWIAMPTKVEIKTNDKDSIEWDTISIPVCLRYLLRGKEMSYVYDHQIYMRDVTTNKITSFLIDMLKYDDRPPQKEKIGYPENAGSSSAFVYTITRYQNMPAYSATYDIHVCIGEICSNTQRVEIVLRENGKLIEHPKK